MLILYTFQFYEVRLKDTSEFPPRYNYLISILRSSIKRLPPAPLKPYANAFQFYEVRLKVSLHFPLYSLLDISILRSSIKRPLRSSRNMILLIISILRSSIKSVVCSFQIKVLLYFNSIDSAILASVLIEFQFYEVRLKVI